VGIENCHPSPKPLHLFCFCLCFVVALVLILLLFLSLLLLLQVSAVILSAAKDPEEFKFTATIATFHPTLFPALSLLVKQNTRPVPDSSGLLLPLGLSAEL
jgi:hypothetical protein